MCNGLPLGANGIMSVAKMLLCTLASYRTNAKMILTGSLLILFYTKIVPIPPEGKPYRGYE